MNSREKIIAIAIGAFVAAVILYGLFQKFLRAPARKLQATIELQHTENNKLRASNAALKRSFGKWVSLRNRTYHDDPSRVPVLLTARVNQLARRAGLGQLPVRTFTGRMVPKSYREIGCMVKGQASLERLTNFLYLLARDRHLHRITNLSITPPQRNEPEVGFSLRYSTLVLSSKLPISDPIPARPAPASQPVEVVLNSPDRSQYDVIARRHLFLPYIPRVAVRQPPQPQPRPQPQPQTPPRPVNQYDRLRVVGLPAFGTIREVHLARDGRDIDEPLLVGAKLPIGEIAMIDYRVMPMPDDPKDISTGRVILKLGLEYWAVELGQTLSQRRILRADELPDQLKANTEDKPTPPATMPAAAKADDTASATE